MKKIVAIITLTLITTNAFTQENPFRGGKQVQPVVVQDTTWTDEDEAEMDGLVYEAELRAEDSIRQAKRDSIANSQLKTTRQIIKRPAMDLVQSEEDCMITLTFYINAEGDICSSPVVITNQTTTSNVELVKQVVDIVKRDIKYSKGEHTELVKLTLKIQAN